MYHKAKFSNEFNFHIEPQMNSRNSNLLATLSIIFSKSRHWIPFKRTEAVTKLKSFIKAIF